LRLDAAEHSVLITWHHLVCDEWSIGLLFEDLRVFWEAEGSGAVPVLPELPVGYGDYACWQRDREARRSGGERDREYWRKELSGASFEVDWPVPARVARGGGGMVTFSVDGAVAAALERLGREEGLTPFMAWLGVFQGFLHRLTGQGDLVTGTPVSLRTRAELHGVVGFFLNTLPIRTRIDGGTTFRQLLRGVRRGVLDGFEHQALPLDEILRLDGASAGAVRQRSLRVAFVMNDGAPRLPRLPGLDAEVEEVDTETAKFELTLFVSRSAEGGWCGGLEYGGERFAREDGCWLRDRFAEVLSELAGTPEGLVRRAASVTGEERRLVVEEFNRTAVKYPEGALLHGMFAEQARRSPGEVAVEFEGRTLSYGELERRANQVANGLRGMGVGVETLVGVCVDRSLELLVGLLGILKAGGAYVPLDPGYPEERLRFMVEDSEAGVVLVQERYRGLVAREGLRVVALDTEWEVFAGEGTEAPEVGVEAGNLAYMIYTSGSTGRPKGVPNTHRGICNRLEWGRREFPLGKGDAVMQKTPTSFDVSVWELFWPLVSGAREVLARPGGQKDPVYLVELMEARKVTVVHFVPSMLQVFLEAVGERRVEGLRHVFCSGEAMWPELERRFFEWSKAGLHNLYGPTEAAVEVTRWSCREGSGYGFVPIGKPIANTRLYVLDEGGEPVGIGVRGELYIGGVQVARGYWKRPELTAERFVEDRFGGEAGGRLYRTGDGCRWMADGNLEYLGRLDSQVKVRGFRVELGEIEAVLGGHEGVSQAAVVAREGAGGGKELVAYVVGREGVEPEVESLRSHLGMRLPEYMVPGEFVAVDRLPLNPSGKVDRKALVPGLGRRLRVERGFEAPRNPDEAALAAIWSGLLGREDVGVRDDFFSLGGHSLLALRMVFEARRRLGWTIPLSVLFAHPTIGELVAAVGSRPPPASLIRGTGLGPPLFFVPGVPGVNYLPSALLEAVGSVGRYCDALQYPGVDGKEAPLDTVEALATHLISRLREIWPRGPFCLGGYSLGGNVAFEMARQLESAGTPPVLVILFDAFAQDALRRRTWFEVLRATARHLVRLGPVGAVRFVRSRLSGKLQARRVQIARELGLAEAETKALAESAAGGVDAVRKRLFDASFRAIASHRAKPYRGRVLLFRSTDRDVAYGLFREVDPLNGWRGLALGAFEIEDVPGDHWSLLAEGKAAYISERTAFHLAALGQSPG
jgi:amino acid adenylation domain-containing protein